MFTRFGGIGVGHISQIPGRQRSSLVIDTEEDPEEDLRMEVDQTTPSYNNHERSVGKDASGSGDEAEDDDDDGDGDKDDDDTVDDGTGDEAEDDGNDGDGDEDDDDIVDDGTWDEDLEGSEY